MRKIILFALAISFAFAPGIHAQEKAKKSEIIAAAVATKMLKKDLVMIMTGLNSDYGRLPLDGNKVTLVNNKFTCDLPYRGSSRINTYGSQDGNIKATDIYVDVESEFNEKKKYYRLNFKFKSDYDSEL